jgi:hypothetical protein
LRNQEIRLFAKQGVGIRTFLRFGAGHTYNRLLKQGGY